MPRYAFKRGGECGQAKSRRTKLATAALSAAALCTGALSTGAAHGALITNTFLDRDDASDLRVATYNVFNDSIFFERPTKFARMAAAIDADVWAFQEMYSHTPAQVKTLMDTVQPLGTPNGWYISKNNFNEHTIASKYPLSMAASNTTPAGYRAVAMALIDLPAATFGSADLYMMNAHYRCCGDEFNDPERQKQSDAFVNWMRDARTPGGSINLPAGTAMMVLGDLNIVGGPQPLTTLLDGNIQNNALYGVDSAPDWDGSLNAQVMARHNQTGSDLWTWRDDTMIYDPGRLDYITYTDSVLELRKSFVLNTVTMTPADRAAAGLQTYDSIYDNVGSVYDHLPVIADFTVATPEPSGALLGAMLATQFLRRRK